jgi:hypothetical protein
MSESMALERMAQIFAELEGYLTVTRVPYLNRYKRSGETRKSNQQGDLDLVGLGPAPNYPLLLVECKGYGGPESYENWFTVNNLCFLQDLIWDLSCNIVSVSHPRWEAEFEAKRDQEGVCKPDEVWIVFPGSFFPQSDPRRLELDEDPDYKDFLKSMSKMARPFWDSWEEEKRAEYEKILLAGAEKLLGDWYEVQVRLFPIHRLIYHLFIGVTKDMVKRRKRYPDTGMEMIRWIARAVWWEMLDLSEIQTEIQKMLVNYDE